MKEPRNILMVLGDTSLSEAVRVLPICHAIKSYWPDSHLSVGYFRETQRALLEMCPQICQLIGMRNPEVTELKHCWRTIRYLFSVARSLWSYDTILLLHRKDTRWPLSLMAMLTEAEVYYKRRFKGTNVLPPKIFHEEITQQMLGVKPARGILKYLPAIYIPEKYKGFAEDFFSNNRLVGSPTVFMNPYRASNLGSWGGMEESHTLLRYLRVAKILSSCGVKVLMHARCRPDETLNRKTHQLYQEKYERRRRGTEKSDIILTGKISIGQLIAMINKCDLLLGEPSGPSWVAAALGKPTVTIVPSIASSLASMLPVVDRVSDLRQVKHTVIVHEGGNPVTESAVARILLWRLSAPPHVYTHDISDLELRRQTTVVLDGVEASAWCAMHHSKMLALPNQL